MTGKCSFNLKQAILFSFVMLLFVMSINSPVFAVSDFLRRPYPVYQNDPTTMMILTHGSYKVNKATISWHSEDGQSGSDSMNVQNSNEHPNRHDYKVISYIWPHGTFKPNTRVYYTVKVHTWKSTSKYSGDFYTAYRHDHKTITFFAYSDTHADSAQDYKPYEKVMDKMWDVSRHDVDRLILLVGDFVQEGGATRFSPAKNNFNKYYYRQSKTHEDANRCYARMPIMTALGNHDFSGHKNQRDNLKYYFQGLPYQMYKRSCGVDPLGHLENSIMDFTYIKQACYSFDYGPVHFISVANQSDEKPDINPAGKEPSQQRFETDYRQYTWLERDLKKNTKPWTVVFFHAPIFDGRSRYEVRNWLIPLFERYKVTAVFQGHHHWFWYDKTSGINGHGKGWKIAYIVLGCGGAWNVWDDNRAKIYGNDMEHRYGFARVTVRPASGKGENAYQMVADVYFDYVSGSGDKRKKKAKKAKNWDWWTKSFELSDPKNY